MPRHRRRVFRAGFAGIALLTAAALAHAQDAEETPRWTPAPAQLEKLEREQKSGAWSIRPPRKAERRVRKDGEETRTLWGIKATGAMVSVIETPVASNRRDVALALNDYVEILRRRAKTFQAFDPEPGLIGDHPYLRVRFSAEGVEGVEKRLYGFVYARVDGNMATFLTGMAPDNSIELMDAAAQTFRRNNDEKPAPFASRPSTVDAK